MGDYFAHQGVRFPASANPAEYMIDVVSGSLSKGQDWAQVWLDSPHRLQRMDELESLNKAVAAPPTNLEEQHEYATSFMTQVKLVCERASVQVG